MRDVALILACLALMVGIAARAHAAIIRRARDTGRRT